MKKLILLSLLAIGLGAGGATAQAGGLSVHLNFGLPLPPLPPLPVFVVPGPVAVVGCAPPVAVSPVYRGYRDYHYHDYRRDARFDDHHRHDRR